jgi:curved DNA-binding protein CbpA
MDKIMEYYKDDYYQFIGINPISSQEEIKESFWAKAKRHHPDMKGGTKSATEKMKKINHVYEILSDPHKRARYDEYRQNIKVKQKRYHSEVRVSKKQSNTHQSRGKVNYSSSKNGSRRK